ncbi:MAG: tripartite tricarboxylate transporter substrate binding protein [Lysobacterales bacterium]
MKSGALFLCAITAATAATAQQYPTRPIRWVAPSASGSTSDIVARLVAEKLCNALGVTVGVDNRPGAGGNISAEIVVKSPPDGYTLLTGITPLAVNPSLYSKLSYDPLRDLAPIMLISSAPLVLVVHPSIPAKTVQELVALAKRRPGELTFPSAGNGTASHLAGEMFKTMAGIQLLHVPHKLVMQGVLDLVAGRMSLMINVLPEMLPFIKGGKLNAIAVTSLKRAEVMPELPTVDESGLRGYAVTSWQGVLAPARTPPEIIARLNQELAKVLRTPEMRTRMSELGLEIAASSPEQFAQHLRSETEKYAKIVKESGAKVD